jgi:hypothetical protein
VTKHTRANPLFAPKCKPSPLVSKQDPHFPRPQPQIPTNGSQINIFIIEILPVDNIAAFKNYTLIGYDWDDDELHISLRSVKIQSKLKAVYQKRFPLHGNCKNSEWIKSTLRKPVRP